MNLTYETPRLVLQVLNGNQAQQVLDFYLDNRKDFEQYEPARISNFYTIDYMRYVLNLEYNLMVRGVSFRYWIFDKNNPEHIIGTFSLRNIVRGSYQKCELGYKMDQHYRRMGLGKEAVSAGIQLAFQDLKLHRIEAFCMPGNQPSIQMLLSLGFECEGNLSQYVEINGTFQDHYLFSLLKS